MLDHRSEDRPTHGPLNVDKLICAGQLLRSTNAVPLIEVLRGVEAADMNSSASDIRDQLLAWLPVMSVCRGRDGCCVLVNLHEFRLNSVGNTFTDILLLCDHEDRFARIAQPRAAEPQPSASDLDCVMHLPHGKPGPAAPTASSLPFLPSAGGISCQLHRGAWTLPLSHGVEALSETP